MTPSDLTPAEQHGPVGLPDGNPAEPAGDLAALGAAAEQLRGHVDQRWVEVADRVRSRAMFATRRSLPLLAQGRHGPVHVSEQVVVSAIHAAIDDIPAIAATAIIPTVDPQHRLTGIVLVVTVQHDYRVLPLADEVRNRTEAVLHEILGPVIPLVTVRDLHVHVGDVSTDDPHTGRQPEEPPVQ